MEVMVNKENFDLNVVNLCYLLKFKDILRLNTKKYLLSNHYYHYHQNPSNSLNYRSTQWLLFWLILKAPSSDISFSHVIQIEFFIVINISDSAASVNITCKEYICYFVRINTGPNQSFYLMEPSNRTKQIRQLWGKRLQRFDERLGRIIITFFSSNMSQ